MTENKNTSVTLSTSALVMQRARDYVKLLKMRLTFLVAISGAFGYMMAAGADFSWLNLLLVGLGGFLVTGSANTFNQVIEADLDKLMKRTAARPLAEKRITNLEAVIYALILGIAGILILWVGFNVVAALLGIISLLSYAFVYTPMKRVHPVAVLIGAIPGGLPPMIGWVAFSGDLEMGAWILFLFQFLWQFPHFWAIAWLLNDDYKRAGFKMLPTSGKSRITANLMLIYALLLVPVAVLPWSVGLIGWGTMAGIMACGVLFAFPAFVLRKRLEDKYAKRLMYASFLYLPLIQILMVVDIFLG